MIRRASLGLAVLLLLAFTWLGVTGGLRQIPQSRTPGQRIQSVAQLSYGILSFVGVVTRFRGRAWGRVILWCWITGMAAAAGFAPVVWGGAGMGVGLVSAAVVVVLGLGIDWLLRAGLAA